VDNIELQMCAHYSLTKEQISMLIGEIEVIINLGARYNIAPTQIVPASPCGRPPLGQHLRNGVLNRRGASNRWRLPGTQLLFATGF